MTDFGGNRLIHFLLVFVGCIPFGLTPAYGSLTDEEVAVPVSNGNETAVSSAAVEKGAEGN